MKRRRAFGRVQGVGAVVLAVGVLLLGVLLLSQGAGYGPDPGFIHLYVALWPFSLQLMLVGAVLLALGWALHPVLFHDSDDATRAGLDR